MCFLQYRPASQAPQGQQFIPPQSTQQFHPSQNMGMPPGQGQPPPFSQPMPQFLSRPLQPGHGAPSTYSQPSMPMTSSMAQPQSNAPGQGVPYPSSYTVRYADLLLTLSWMLIWQHLIILFPSSTHHLLLVCLRQACLPSSNLPPKCLRLEGNCGCTQVKGLLLLHHCSKGACNPSPPLQLYQ